MPQVSVVANFYGVKSRNLQRQYKNYLSDFKSWNQKSHAKDWMLFAKNSGSHLSLDETAFSNGDLFFLFRLTNIFRAQFRGVRDVKFFLFRLTKLYA